MDIWLIRMTLLHAVTNKQQLKGNHEIGKKYIKCCRSFKEEAVS